MRHKRLITDTSCIYKVTKLYDLTVQVPTVIPPAMADNPFQEALREKLPRHTEIKTYLLDRMRSGALQPNGKTESENELARRFSVSRLTVQRAIRELVAEGASRAAILRPWF
jgi:hypothetical protein